MSAQINSVILDLQENENVVITVLATVVEW